MDIQKILPLLLSLAAQKNQGGTSSAGLLGSLLGGKSNPSDLLSMFPVDDKTKAILTLALGTGGNTGGKVDAQAFNPFSKISGISGNEINQILCNVFESQKQ